MTERDCALNSHFRGVKAQCSSGSWCFMMSNIPMNLLYLWGCCFSDACFTNVPFCSALAAINRSGYESLLPVTDLWRLGYVKCFSYRILFIEILLLGTFLIKPQKKAEAEKKFAKHLGMIAGGTGKTSHHMESLEKRDGFMDVGEEYQTLYFHSRALQLVFLFMSGDTEAFWCFGLSPGS